MAQKYRIYINDNTLLITDRLLKHLDKSQHLDSQNFDFPTFYKNLAKGGRKSFVLLSDRPKVLMQQIKSSCLVVKAGGGLVSNDRGEYLFIFRNKKWDLPKGKVEKGEAVKATAVREVEEECGVKITSRDKRLCKTYHVYEMDNRVVLKRTTWYKMKVKGNPNLKPQKEEGITAAEWVDAKNISPKAQNTYPSIIDVLDTANLL